MEQHDSKETRDPEEILRLMAALCQSGDLSLQLESANDTARLVTLEEADEDKLQLNLSASPGVASEIADGERFRLAGQAHGTLIRTPSLTAKALGEALFELEYPDSLTTVRRRDTFRAPLHHDMLAVVSLSTPDGQHISGQLENLSVGGCLLKLPLIAAAQLADSRDPVSLAVRFPNGEEFRGRAKIRHVHKVGDWTHANAGCEFVGGDPDFGRDVAYFVREIERHAARRADRYGQWLAPSELFTDEPPERAPVLPPPDITLAAVSAFLALLIENLKDDASINLDKLLIYSHAIILQLRLDRQALLFAATRLTGQSLLIKHCICVAIRLGDVAFGDYSKQELRTIIACALIHDLGKALLPQGILDVRGSLDADERTTVHTHVSRLVGKLPQKNTLSDTAVAEVIVMANERLDGSGYPNSRSGDALPRLARMMAVVDVADAMRRPRPDRAPWPQDRIYAHLLSHGELFDSYSVQRYIRRFGKTPVGTLAFYSTNVLAWIERLNELGEPTEVRLALRLGTRKQRLDKVIRGGDISVLGHLDRLVEPGDFDL